MTIKDRRAELHMTQTALAEAAGVNLRQIQKIESGEIQIGNVTLRNAARIAEALEIPLESLLE